MDKDTEDKKTSSSSSQDRPPKGPPAEVGGSARAEAEAEAGAEAEELMRMRLQNSKVTSTVASSTTSGPTVGGDQTRGDEIDGDADVSKTSGKPHLHLVKREGQSNGDQGAIDDADHDLVERAKVGDQAAFAILFERHHRRVHAMCCRLLRDRTEVEDAVQQAFMEAWRCLAKFEGRSKFSTWITRIAIHTCLGIRRRLKRIFFSEDTHPQESTDADAQWSHGPMAPDAGAAHEARKRAVHEVLQQLSPKKRVVFVLAELDGMTAPEIAEILQIPDATVRTRLFHARKEFAVKVETHPGFADCFGGAS